MRASAWDSWRASSTRGMRKALLLGGAAGLSLAVIFLATRTGKSIDPLNQSAPSIPLLGHTIVLDDIKSSDAAAVFEYDHSTQTLSVRTPAAWPCFAPIYAPSQNFIIFSTVDGLFHHLR